MILRRGLAAPLVGLLAVVGACTAPAAAPAPSASPSAPFDAKAALAAATAGIEAGVYEYRLVQPGGGRSQGVLNVPRKTAEFNVTMTLKRGFEGQAQIRNVGAGRYVRFVFSKAEIKRQIAADPRSRKITVKQFEEVNGTY